MLKKTVTYTDYNGIERTEDFYFNLTKAELMELEMGTTGGLAEKITKMVNANEGATIMNTFKEIMMKAYGVKSSDGRRFIKTKEVKEEFEQTEAFSIIYMEMLTDATKASDFINGIIPAEVRADNN